MHIEQNFPIDRSFEVGSKSPFVNLQRASMQSEKNQRKKNVRPDSSVNVGESTVNFYAEARTGVNTAKSGHTNSVAKNSAKGFISVADYIKGSFRAERSQKSDLNYFP